MTEKLIFFLFFMTVYAQGIQEEQTNRYDLTCRGRAHYNATLTAYYPNFYSEDESDYLDLRGKKLRTLQDFIDGRAEFVTVAMDNIPKLNYASEICVPEINEHFGRIIPLQVRDYGAHLEGKSYTRLDICVRTETDSYDNAVNRLVTIYTT